jgi:transcriptional regulator with XRE-family HTH domain
MTTESLELAGKLKQCMKEANMTPAELARLMEVKAPSVYDWMNFGRIAKPRLNGLSKIFNRPLEWWLGIEGETELLNDHERQLIAMYRNMKTEGQEKLLQEANWLHNLEKPEASHANPFPLKPAPSRKK